MIVHGTSVPDVAAIIEEMVWVMCASHKYFIHNFINFNILEIYMSMIEYF